MTKLELFLAANPEIMASKGFLFAAAGDGGDGCGSRECAPDPVEGDGKDNNPSETKPEDPKEGETKPEDPKKPDESEDGKPKEGVSVSVEVKDDEKDGFSAKGSVSMPIGDDGSAKISGGWSEKDKWGVSSSVSMPLGPGKLETGVDYGQSGLSVSVKYSIPLGGKK